MQPVSIKHLVFIAGDAVVRAYDTRPTSPVPLWTTKLPHQLFAGTSQTLANLNQLFVGSGASVYRLDVKTGSIIWQRAIISMPAGSSPILILNGSFLIVAVEGTIATLDKETGTVLWTKSLGSIAPSLLSIPNQLLVGTVGELHSLHPMTGKELWKNALEGCGYHPVTLSCDSSHKRIIVGTAGYIVSVSPDGKTLSKKVALKDSIYSSISQIPYGPDTIIQHSNFVSLISDDGNEKWRTDLKNERSMGPGVLSFHENNLWVGLSATLNEINPSTGEKLRELTIDVLLGTAFLSTVAFLNFVFIENFAYVDVCGKFYKVDLKAPGGMISVWEDELSGFGYYAHYLSCYNQNQNCNQAPLGAFIQTK